RRLRRRTEHLAEALAARLRLTQCVLGVVDRLRPEPTQKEEQDRLLPPLVQRLADRPHVPERLRHLLADELEHAVVRPCLGELVPERARLRDLVLVVREDEVDAAAVDLEHRAEQLLGHHRALDVPSGPPPPPRRFPPGVLALLVPLPERKVARILL